MEIISLIITFICGVLVGLLNHAVLKTFLKKKYVNVILVFGIRFLIIAIFLTLVYLITRMLCHIDEIYPMLTGATGLIVTSLIASYRLSNKTKINASEEKR